MHKLMDYVCDEMEELERKVEKEGKLSSAEMQYLDVLAHTKKNLLKADEYEDGEYSGRYDDMRYSRRYDGPVMSYARGRGRNARRDAMGRYSSANEDMVAELRELMDDAPDEHTKMEFKKFIQKIEQM